MKFLSNNCASKSPEVNLVNKNNQQQSQCQILLKDGEKTDSERGSDLVKKENKKTRRHPNQSQKKNRKNIFT